MKTETLQAIHSEIGYQHKVVYCRDCAWFKEGMCTQFSALGVFPTTKMSSCSKGQRTSPVKNEKRDTFPVTIVEPVAHSVEEWADKAADLLR